MFLEKVLIILNFLEGPENENQYFVKKKLQSHFENYIL